MILVDKLLMGGIGWVLRRVSDAADTELYDESSLREELLAAEMQLELGEIGEEEYAAIEASVLERMRATRAREEPEPGARFEIEAIEADVGEEEIEPPPPPQLPPAKPARPPATKSRKRRRAAKARSARVR